jgi:L,D-transpeptidase catalytic domain
VLTLAVRAYSCGQRLGYFDRPVLTVIDYSLPSTEPRLWVIDLQHRRVLFNELVAHGLNSGDNYASAFSNRLGSKQSSLGLFRTADTYEGQHGRSLRLVGLEPGVNDLAEKRAIVIHGAPYVSTTFAAAHGRLGRSWGCPAVPEQASQPVIDHIEGGTAVFAYYPDQSWLNGSRFLHCDARLARG